VKQHFLISAGCWPQRRFVSNGTGRSISSSRWIAHNPHYVNSWQNGSLGRQCSCILKTQLSQSASSQALISIMWVSMLKIQYS